MTLDVSLAAEPQLFTRDLEAALAFYTGPLGFRLAFRWGEPAFYAQVERGGARLNLRLSPHPFHPPEIDGLAATLTLDDPEPLFQEFDRAGVSLARGLAMEAWGARTFTVADPDGNLLLFAGRPA